MNDHEEDLTGDQATRTGVITKHRAIGALPLDEGSGMPAGGMAETHPKQSQSNAPDQRNVVSLGIEAEKLKAEIEKLRAERRNLDAEFKQRGWMQWAIRILGPTLLGSVAAAGASAIFADSLEARNRAEIRRDVLQTYFDVENAYAGKRKQILDFIELVAVEDHNLQAWVEHERPNVEAALEVAKKREEKVGGRQDELMAQIERLKIAEGDFVELLLETASIQAWIEKASDSPRSVPGDIGKLLTDEQNAALIALINEVPDAMPRNHDLLSCSSLSDALHGKQEGDVGGNSSDELREQLVDNAEECRADLIEWARTHARDARLDLYGQIVGPSQELEEIWEMRAEGPISADDRM